LKIDRSFVAGVGVSSQDRACVKAIVDLARGLCLDVVAEGIEDAAQLHELVGLGCDLGQGYHLYRPVPAVDLRHLVGRRDLAPATG